MTSRRSFLKQAALGAVTLASGPAFSPLTLACSPKKEKLGIALVGLGYYSTDLLAPALAATSHCYLAGIVTGTPSKAEQWVKRHKLPEKNVYNYENFDQIANNPDIDVVYVVLPPFLHKEYVIRAAKAGKQVFCEKPMAMNADECSDMIRACKENKVALAIGYRMQHDPHTREIMRFAKEKTLGAVKHVKAGAGYRESRIGHWKTKKALGGGAMMDMGVYALQGGRYATGEEPIEVMARHETTRPELFGEVDEITKFSLRFPSGATADLETSFAGGMNYLNATTEKGWFKLEPFQAYSGVRGESSRGPINFQTGNQQARQMDDDALAIMNKKPLLVPGEEGLRDMRVVDAIYQSAKAGNTVRLT